MTFLLINDGFQTQSMTVFYPDQWRFFNQKKTVFLNWSMTFFIRTMTFYLNWSMTIFNPIIDDFLLIPLIIVFNAHQWRCRRSMTFYLKSNVFLYREQLRFNTINTVSNTINTVSNPIKAVFRPINECFYPIKDVFADQWFLLRRKMTAFSQDP